MAATPSFLFARWISLLAVGGALTGVPLGFPPLPEDPALSRIAPDECLWYFAAAGMATPDPTSENQTERLLAEPELQEMARSVEMQIVRAIRRNAHGRGERILSDEVPRLVKTALLRPLAIYVSDFRAPGPEGPASIRAGLVVSLGDRADRTAKSLAQLEELLYPEREPATTEEADVTWHAIPLPRQFPPIEWAIVDGYLIVGAGEGEAAAILDRLQSSNPTPRWLERIRRELAPDQVATVGYVHVAGLVERIAPILGEKRIVLSFLGLDDVDAIYSVVGLDERGCISRTKIAIDGEPEGLLALLPQKPLSKRDLDLIPFDANAAIAVRIDADETFEQILDLVDSIDPDARDEFEDDFREFESMLDVDIREDLLQAVDDVWIAYLPGGDLFTSWIGATAVVQVKDRQRLERGMEKFLDRARIELQRGSDRGAVIRRTRFGNQTIQFMSIPDDDMPFAPAWTVTDDYLVVGLMPQTVKAFLARVAREDGDDSLYDAAGVADALSAHDGPACVAYLDMERLVRGMYPLLQVGARMVCVELRREGMDVDVSLLPSIEAIAPHLGPAVSTWSRIDDGFLAESRQPLPSGGNLAGTLPMAVAFVFPAMQTARSAAWDTQEMNHLKNLALAFHNYTDVHGALPKDIYSEEGKPLLSWRVQLLPYLEDSELFDEFHLDEPWDSEHNKRLMERMPLLLSSPSGPAQPGKTRFLALAGEGTLFPGDEKLTFANVTDGLSNTLMFVRAAPQAAVPWTKPEDIAFDPKNPKRGLDSPQRTLLAAFGDGSVRRLSLGMSDQTLRRLALKSDGEAIDEEDLNASPGR